MWPHTAKCLGIFATFALPYLIIIVYHKGEFKSKILRNGLGANFWGLSSDQFFLCYIQRSELQRWSRFAHPTLRLLESVSCIEKSNATSGMKGNHELQGLRLA